MNGESNPRPRLGAFAGEPVPMTEFERTPSLSGWKPPARMEEGRPDYGLDAPTIVAGSFALAGVSAAFGALLGAIRIRGRRIPLLGLVTWLLSFGGAALGTSLVAYGKKASSTIATACSNSLRGPVPSACSISERAAAS